MAVIRHRPMTAKQIAAHLSLKPCTVTEYIRLMRAKSMVYVCGFERGVSDKPCRIYKAGDYADMVYKSRKARKHDQRSATSRLRILATISEPMSAFAIADASGYSLALVRSRIGELRALGEVYIKEWVTTAPRAIYARGNHPDSVYIPARKRLKCRATSNAVSTVHEQICR